jgi:hypothetical protein
MKSQVLGVLAASMIGLASSAHALNISVGNIIPPGGNAEQASLVAGTDMSLFATGSGVDRSMTASDITTLSGIAGLYSGSVVVVAMNTSAGTSLIIMSDTNFSIGSATASEAISGYETGGMTVLSNGMGGLNAFGGPSASGGLFAFALTGLDAWATGGVTLAKGNTTSVKFLEWRGGWTVSNTGNYNGSSSSSSLTFNFEVLPVPAPALLAGAGLLGATVVRRRMKKN